MLAAMPLAVTVSVERKARRPRRCDVGAVARRHGVGCDGDGGARRAARWRRARHAHASPCRAASTSAPPAPTSCASTSRSIRPRSITTMRSATSSTRSRFCSTTTSDEPARACAGSRRISPISCTIEGWMPSDGSSSRSSHGSAISARADARGSAARRPTARRRLRSSSGAGAGRVSRTRSIASCSVSPRIARSRRGAGSRARSGRAGCRGPAARSRGRGGCASCAFIRVTSMPSIADPAGGRRHQADQRSSGSVVLPMPLWPTMPTASPSCSCERRRRAGPARGRSRRAGRRRRARRRRASRGDRRASAIAVRIELRAHLARLPM